MTTQIDTVEQKIDKPATSIKTPEVIRDHSEIERVEMLAVLNHDGCKDNLTMCGVSMMESGKAGAFVIYKDNEKITISDPILEEADPVCHFGNDLTHNWGIDTKTDDFLDPDNPKYRQLFMDSTGRTPRTDAWVTVVTFPAGELASQGFNAKDIRRPTKAWLEFFVKQNEIRPGFTTGILTNDGKRSGLLLFKQDENSPVIESKAWRGLLGDGEMVDRGFVLARMKAAGIIYSDIDLSCPKNRDPSKLYEKRVTQAVNEIF
jgi:hypothetical protein